MIDRSSNSQIAKNTVMLYFRMAVTMLVQLYTSRLVLMALGFSDYGLYNVVGGIVILFGFMDGAMRGTTQRYITYELGKGNFESLRSVFSSSVQLHVLIAVLVIILSELVGSWLIYNEMQIPEGRLIDVLYVFQISILASVTNIIFVPYNAAIVAHERMSIFAYVSIAEVLVRLLLVYLLLLLDSNRLIAYAVMVFVSQLAFKLFYFFYCRKHFKETIYTHRINKKQLKEMCAFSGWNLWGNVAVALNTQGLNILLNMYFGPVVNAARGIAVQVQTNMYQFSGNFQTAVIPELTKSYAAGEHSKTLSLMYRASRFSFYLLYLVTLPVLLETDAILNLWLKDVPDNSVLFVRILLICQLIFAMEGPLSTVAYATGDIKKLNIVCGLIVLFALPVSWMILKMGAPAYSVFLIVLVLELVSFIARLQIVSESVNFSMSGYFVDVILKSSAVAISSLAFAGTLYYYLPSNDILTVLIVCSAAMASVAMTALYLGMSTSEREFVYNIVKSHIRKIS